MFNSKELWNDHKSFFLIPISLQPNSGKPWIFQTLTIGPDITHSLKYQRSTTLGCSDMGIRKLVFVIMEQLPFHFMEGIREPTKFLYWEKRNSKKNLRRYILISVFTKHFSTFNRDVFVFYEKIPSSPGNGIHSLNNVI